MLTREEANARQRGYYRAKATEISARVRADRAANPEKYREWERKKYYSDPRSKMLSGAKLRAKKEGLPFNLTRDDIHIPNFCPVLGIPLKVAAGAGNSRDHSPSLDKIVPEFGYVKGNIAIISSKANSIKNNASPEELTRVANWLRTVYPQWLLMP